MLILAMGSLIVFLVMVHLIIGRTCRESRSVLLELPIDKAWESIRDFGALHAEHGRGQPLVTIASSTLTRGDGLTPGSIWRQEGTWDGSKFWCEIEVIEVEAPHRLVVSLKRDIFATQSGLMRHRVALDLQPFDARRTRLRLQLSARLYNLRLVLMRTLSPERMQTRLLDLALRSAKLAFEGAYEPHTAMPVLPFAAPIMASSPLVPPGPPADGAAEPAVALGMPSMLPEWIKPEVAAAALASLRPTNAPVWGRTPEGALDQS